MTTHRKFGKSLLVFTPTVVTLLLIVFFQNCAPKKFSPSGSIELQSVGQNSVADTTSCSSLERPFDQEVLSCPADSIGDGALRTRQVLCSAGSWVVLPWSAPDYTSCKCNSGKLMNAMTGTCECPSGQAVINGLCKNTSCDPSLQPPLSEAGSCPSGKGNSTRTRAVSCQLGSWVAATWSTFNYTTCSCPATQTANPLSGVCECPTGQVFNGTSCVAPTCDPSTMLPVTESISCPSGTVGTASHSRTSTCTNLQWTYGNWTNDYSTCSCAGVGQIFDPSKSPACDCPSGYSLVSGTCKPLPKACDATQKPVDSMTTTCPAPAVGSISIHRDVTCDTSTGIWNSSQFPAYNYSSCTCPYLGQSPDASSGACGCPAGQYVVQGSCGVCPATSTYDSASQTCQSALPLGKMTIVATQGFGFISPPSSMMYIDSNSVLWSYGLNWVGSEAVTSLPPGFDSSFCLLNLESGCRKLDCKVNDCSHLVPSQSLFDPIAIQLAQYGYTPDYSINNQNWCVGPPPATTYSGYVVQTYECGPSGWRPITMSNSEGYYGTPCTAVNSPYPLGGFQLSVKTGSRRLYRIPQCITTTNQSTNIQWID
jgi:hypothetical protein